MQVDDTAFGRQAAGPDATEGNGTPELGAAEGHHEESPPLVEGAHETVDQETAPPEPVKEAASEEQDAAGDGEATSELAAAEETPTDEQTQLMEAWLDSDDLMQSINRGDILEGTVMRATPSEVLIDVGAKTEGVLSGRELDRMDADKLASLEVGSSVMVYVLTPEDRNGNILLSISRAEEEKDWTEAERYMAEGLTYEGSISGFNKGGLIVRFGRLRGFVPASQVSTDRRRRSIGSTPEERWGSMLHEPIMTKVIEVDRGRNRLILSERAATKESRAARKAALLEKLEVGQVTSGRVISLTDFGAFVDLGGADGLVHLSELSWQHVTHPGEVLSVGDEVEVQVISLDREQQRIGLSLKRLKDDPWVEIASRYEVGQLVQGTITKLTKFGAFARLVDTPEIEGLIHISELSDRRVKHPSEVVDENQVLTLRIVRINPDRRRMGLSLKRVDSEAYLDADWQIMAAEAAEPQPRAGPADEAAAVPETDAAEAEPAAVPETEAAAGIESKANQEPASETHEEAEPEEAT